MKYVLFAGAYTAKEILAGKLLEDMLLAGFELED